MTDLDQILRADAEQWQRAVDSGARPSYSRRAESRGPLLLVASAVVVLLAIVITTLALTSRHGRPDAAPARRTSTSATAPHAGGPPPSASLYSVLWSAPESVGTVVFAASTANISDVCDSGLQALSVHGHELIIGQPVGQQSTCGGTTRGPSPATLRFDRIVHRGRLHWSIVGHTLTLTSRSGRSLRLTTTGAPAPAITGQHWRLSRVQGAHGELRGSYGNATFMIGDGRLHASDLCNDITGDATTTATQVRFTHVIRTTRPCPYSNLEHASAVIDTVLDGSRTFSIYRSRQLIVYAGSDMLIYLPSS